jgi:AraC-like DNA-binding protein
MDQNQITQGVSFKEQFLNVIKKSYSDAHFSFVAVLPKFEMSLSSLTRKVKKEYDTTPQVYLREYRLSMAREMLRESDKTISIIAEECGFNSMSYFNRTFKTKYGNSPTRERKKTV